MNAAGWPAMLSPPALAPSTRQRAGPHAALHGKGAKQIPRRLKYSPCGEPGDAVCRVARHTAQRVAPPGGAVDDLGVAAALLLADGQSWIVASMMSRRAGRAFADLRSAAITPETADKAGWMPGSALAFGIPSLRAERCSGAFPPLWCALCPTPARSPGRPRPLSGVRGAGGRPTASRRRGGTRLTRRGQPLRQPGD